MLSLVNFIVRLYFTLFLDSETTTNLLFLCKLQFSRNIIFLFIFHQFLNKFYKTRLEMNQFNGKTIMKNLKEDVSQISRLQKNISWNQFAIWKNALYETR